MTSSRVQPYITQKPSLTNAMRGPDRFDRGREDGDALPRDADRAADEPELLGQNPLLEQLALQRLVGLGGIRREFRKLGVELFRVGHGRADSTTSRSR